MLPDYLRGEGWGEGLWLIEFVHQPMCVLPRNDVMMSTMHTVLFSQTRVVIIGAGFGGLAAAKALGGKAVQVTVLERENHHLFQPLLYQVATAGLSPANIAQPVRSILRQHQNIEVLMADVTGIDVEKKRVLAGERGVPFDYLIVATGARHGYFGHPEWEAFAPGPQDARRRARHSPPPAAGV